MRVVAGGGYDALALAVDQREIPVAAAYLGEQLAAILAADTVQVAPAAVAIDIVDRQRAAMHAETGGRDEHVLAAKLAAPAQAQAAVGAAAQLEGRFTADAGAAAGDHVDHAEHGIAAVDRRARAANHLDALDQTDVEREGRIGRGAGVDVLVHRLAVDQDLLARPVVARPRDAAHAAVGIGMVVGDVETLQAAQRRAQRAPAVEADVGGGDDGDHGRNAVRVLGKFRCRNDAHLHQVFEVHVDGVDGAGRQGGSQQAGSEQGSGQRAPGGAGSQAHQRLASPSLPLALATKAMKSWAGIGRA